MKEKNTGKFTKPRRIVFTGGPSGGKTSIIEIVQRRFGAETAAVPEAATVLYGGGFPRPQGDPAMRHIQRAIYFTVRELEDMAFTLDGSKIFLCDRGTLDGMAYWPAGEPDFLASVGSALEKELSRYDILIHLRPPLRGEVYHLSGARIESHSAALALDKKTEKAWREHPKRFVIADEPDFLIKVNKVLAILEKEIPLLLSPQRRGGRREET
ncbi:MAG: ATP-binding protein [Elusimicrobia bacterium]|nr:ATP-binding protein [Elusimicrobiota bacterium]